MTATGTPAQTTVSPDTRLLNAEKRTDAEAGRRFTEPRRGTVRAGARHYPI